MRRVRFLITIVALAVGLFVLPTTPATSANPIQPGDFVGTSVGGCTLGFVYDGLGSNAGKVFIGTAAHCVENVGDLVEDIDGQAFGRVALIGDEDSTAADFAFIEVLPEFVSSVNPAMVGHPQYPTGVTTSSQTAVGDTIQMSGYGVGFNITALTRESRIGIHTFDDADEYTLIGPDIFGDSGGPLVHIPTGGAYGIVSRLCIGLCTSEGPTVEGILAQAAARSFPVALRTV